jgi:putative SOS response-associated peptidase YedK
MCGRFTQYFTYAELHQFWSMFIKSDAPAPLGNLQPRYHICPTDPIVAVLQTKTGLSLERVRWGLAPFWWKQPLKKLPATFNARAETVAEKPMFRSGFKSRRCVIPASGFYEWTGAPGSKTPHYFTAPSGEPLAFAALWEQAKHPETGEPLTSTTILVGPANGWTSRFHDRMPVILDWRDIGEWMGGDTPSALLNPPPEDALQEWVVSNRVNRAGVGDDDPTLISPAAAPPTASANALS